MKKECRTNGNFFIVPTMSGNKGIIGLDYNDYEKLLAVGIMDEEINLRIDKVEYGIEYEQGAPSIRVRAGLYTITIGGIHVKPQIDISEQELPHILERGFVDGDKVFLTIESLPYRSTREASYDGIKLDIDL